MEATSYDERISEVSNRQKCKGLNAESLMASGFMGFLADGS